MQKPYIKKYGKIAHFTIWTVDGQYIRKNIDEEFTNFGQHYRFSFIPKDEFWIDHEYGPGEDQFYIDHLLVENRLMASGMSYDKALMRADQIEKKERSKSALIKRIASLDSKHLIDDIHKTLLRKYSKNVNVWIVRGELVRGLLFIDFTEGGHDKVYPFVPEKEIWLDDELGPQERKFVLLHELHERYLMSQGWIYKKAHKDSSESEYYCRSHPEELEAKLQLEIDRNK